MRVAFALSLHVLVGCSATRSATLYSGVIHPKVFLMVTCWISDTAKPVVTEVNLDAVARNRNQFCSAGVSTNGEWVRYDDPDSRGFLRYKALEPKAGLSRVVFQESGGGSLMWSGTIGYTIIRRFVETPEGRKEIAVLRVEAVEQ